MPDAATLAGATAAAATLLYLARLNRAMTTTPQDMLKLSPDRWTKEDVEATFRRLQEKPLDWTPHLPPRTGRRYIIVGGSGLVGGQIVLHLLARGEPPSAIRIIDSRPPTRPDLLAGPASQVDLALADIRSQASTTAAFLKPWDPSIDPSASPLTVFHTAAVLRPSERSPLVYHRVSGVNVDGTAHALAAAREAGADVFVATSSCSVALLPISYWMKPWEERPKGHFQVMTEDDFDRPLRPDSQFFANYASSKAKAERLVCAANEMPPPGSDLSRPGGFRTGTIRPGSAIYGGPEDVILDYMLTKRNPLPTHISACSQNWVHTANVSLAHLVYEARLLSPDAPRLAARPYLVTDAGPPLHFDDHYTLLRAVSSRPPSIFYPPPVLILILAYLIEWYCIVLWRVPFLGRFFPEPGFPAYWLQPAALSSSANILIDDSQARKSPAEGGLGYKPVCTSKEGMCLQMVIWNDMFKRLDAAEVKRRQVGT